MSPAKPKTETVASIRKRLRLVEEKLAVLFEDREEIEHDILHELHEQYELILKLPKKK